MNANGLRLSPLGSRVLDCYAGSSWLTRLFLNARWRWTPYEQIAQQMPQSGLILDLGSGYGLLSLAMGFSSPARIIRGIDHDPRRVEIARQAARGLSNVEFELGTLESAMAEHLAGEAVAGIVVIDAMHYLTPSAQEHFLHRARHVLQRGGVLLIRDVDADAGKTFFINRFYEKAMTNLGATRANQLHFRSKSEWHQMLTDVGFNCASEECSRFPFADRLFCCRRPAAAMRAA